MGKLFFMSVWFFFSWFLLLVIHLFSALWKGDRPDKACFTALVDPPSLTSMHHPTYLHRHTPKLYNSHHHEGYIHFSVQVLAQNPSTLTSYSTRVSATAKCPDIFLSSPTRWGLSRIRQQSWPTSLQPGIISACNRSAFAEHSR